MQKERRKKVLKDLREIKKTIARNKNIRRNLRDEENRIVISMNVKDDKDFLSVFSKQETPVISESVADFIEHSAATVPPSEKIILNIISNCIDDTEKIDYERAIKEYYTEKYLANKQEMKRNTFISIALAIIGVLVLALSFLTNSMMWAEVIDIIAWVFLWEAVDISIFKNRSLRIRQVRYLSYIEMKVVYK